MIDELDGLRERLRTTEGTLDECNCLLGGGVVEEVKRRFKGARDRIEELHGKLVALNCGSFRVDVSRVFSLNVSMGCSYGVSSKRIFRKGTHKTFLPSFSQKDFLTDFQ